MKQYDRWQYSSEQAFSEIVILTPDGKEEKVQSFRLQPAKFSYDRHGYETVSANGPLLYAARYTPKKPGVYHFTVIMNERETERGEWECEASDNHGFIHIRKKDSRYFAYSDGTPFCPVGINLCYPTAYDYSDGTEFGINGQKCYLGIRQYEAWFKNLSQNGVNLVRLWLGHEYFNPDTGEATELNYLQFAKIDAVVELAEQYGIKLKLTFEHFRDFSCKDTVPDGYNGYIYKLFHKTLNYGNRACQSMEEWLTDPLWKSLWLKKVSEFTRRYGGNTSIFTFEFWNEMNAVTADFDTVAAWNREMMPKCKKLAPDNLWVNSLGSLDAEYVQNMYDFYLKNTEDDFIQFHRYLDQGARLNCCQPCDFTGEGIKRVQKDNRPILLAETGAVNDCHSGPFRYYSADHRGIIFADCVYTPFFCGSAGCGNIWHWDERYVESKNLYHMYQKFSEFVHGIALDEEQFVCRNCSDDRVWMYLLVGKTVTLGYIRNKSDSWDKILRDGQQPEPLQAIELPRADKSALYPIWPGETAEAAGNQIQNLRYGVFLKLYK